MDSFAWMLWHLYRPDTIRYIAKLIGVDRTTLTRGFAAHWQTFHKWGEAQVRLLSPEDWLRASKREVIEGFNHALYYVDVTTF